MASSHGIPHSLSADQVEVQVVNHLAGIRSGVVNQAISILCDTFLDSQVSGQAQQPSDQGLVLRHELIDGGNMLVWHDQDMYGAGRINIPESRHLFILVQDCAGGLPAYNLAEKTIIHNLHL
jgi:hypothetical protein